MNLLCGGIADWCKKNGAVSEENYPIILYGIQVLLNTSLKVLGILLTGALLHRFVAVAISMAVFCSMRYWTGGWHSKSHLGCFCTMLIPCVCPSLLMGVDGAWVPWVLRGMLVYSVYAVIRYAPCNSEVNPICDPKILKAKRVGSVMEMLGVVIGMFLCSNVKTLWLISVPLFANAIMLNYRKGNFYILKLL